MRTALALLTLLAAVSTAAPASAGPRKLTPRGAQAKATRAFNDGERREEIDRMFDRVLTRQAAKTGLGADHAQQWQGMSRYMTSHDRAAMAKMRGTLVEGDGFVRAHNPRTGAVHELGFNNGWGSPPLLHSMAARGSSVKQVFRSLFDHAVIPFVGEQPR